MWEGRTFAVRSASSTASAMAFTCRVFCPEHNTKKSVNAGVLRRSSSTTSDAFFSRAARTTRPISPVSLLGVRRFSVFVMQVICRKGSDAGGIQPVLRDVPLDGSRHEAVNRPALGKPFPNVGRRHIGSACVDQKNAE